MDDSQVELMALLDPEHPALDGAASEDAVFDPVIVANSVVFRKQLDFPISYRGTLGTWGTFFGPPTLSPPYV